MPDLIDQLIAAHRAGDIELMRALEAELRALGWIIDYGPGGVYYAEPST